MPTQKKAISPLKTRWPPLPLKSTFGRVNKRGLSS